MQIVINIDENLYTRLFDNGVDNYDDAEDMAKAIRKGVLLPRGHGRLIDADELVPDCQEDFVYYDDDEHNVFTAVGIAQIECADTIIEADTESENKE